MSNAYGFDFLRNEHLDESAQQDVVKAEGNADADSADDTQMILSEEKLAEVQNLPMLEKQHMILDFLRAHRGSGCLAPNVIWKTTGIDLENYDTKLAESLQKNPKIKVDMVPDPENPALMIATYAYQAKYSMVRDRTSLLAQINRMVSGVPKKDLEDSYPNVEEDLQALITAGDVVAVQNNEDKDKILFPRGEAFLVELDGIVSVKVRRKKAPVVPAPAESSSGNANNDNGQSKSDQSKIASTVDETGEKKDSAEGADPTNDAGDANNNKPKKEKQPILDIFLVGTDVDPCSQIRRGEAIQVGGEWFRVSSAVKAGVSLAEQPARAQAPLSVVSLTDLPKRNEVDGYIRPLDQKTLPIDKPLPTSGIKALQKAKKARERLAKVAHGAGAVRSSGAGGGSLGVLVGQALGSLAHSGNPTALASAAASSSGPISSSNRRKRNAVAASAPVGSAVATKEELISAASDITLATFSHARRHGCTKDIRQMYLETASMVPESDVDLQAKLVEHKLLEPGEKMRRERIKRHGQGANVDNDGKPKKRRYYERKNQRMTNTHLDGTTEGAILALALEHQKQGKSVGDGGM
eukprot:CAMPEP_0172454376 /NCGR_PEP_ID=MMETSP1065-20121228/11385_1 /TAXON_ID=265537 /ORGANISM="Amphiprora paludosa, Strain CCMP125" /LENGTH=580 /DNA_ID=CAMNT_0013206697 /DNA_START=127 /DNA_END=1869 /DNA_ORIENTATION=+